MRKLNNIFSFISKCNKLKKRLGRGIGSGKGKTAGRGHKGQKSRSGGYHKIGFEGGQTPLNRRLPKFGFSSRKSIFFQEIRLHELSNINSKTINLNILKKNGIIRKNKKHVKIIKKGNINCSFVIYGINCSKGAKIAIEKAGGKLEI